MQAGVAETGQVVALDQALQLDFAAIASPLSARGRGLGGRGSPSGTGSVGRACSLCSPGGFSFAPTPTRASIAA
jgi:hypothetical protein